MRTTADPSYTGDLAKAEPARSIRKAEGRVSRSPLLDGALRVLSVPYAVLCVVLMIVGIPDLLAGRRRDSFRS